MLCLLTSEEQEEKSRQLFVQKGQKEKYNQLNFLPSKSLCLQGDNITKIMLLDDHQYSGVSPKQL